MHGRIALAATTLIALAAPSTALAGSPGHWTRVTQALGQNIDQVDLVRTGDGVLHAVWRVKNAADQTKQDVFSVAIQTNGTVEAPVAIQQGWAQIGNPAIVLDPGGLRAFWGGIRSIDPDETQNEMQTATAPASGASWALAPGNVVKDDASYSGDTSATVAGGTFWQTWATSGGLWVHRGANGAPKVYARRSDPTVTHWGETGSVKPPPGATDGWKLDADAQSAVVDVLGAFTVGGSIATWHTQLRPGLTLRSLGVKD